MADEPPISPVERVHADAAEPADRAPRPPSAAAAPRTAGRTLPVAPPSLGEVLAHRQLDHPIRPPRGVDVTAQVHDSAAHGNRIAAAVEQAQRGEPTDRARQLGGAAASAASGQAARIERTSTDTELAGDDPLAPVDGVDPRDGRQQHPGSHSGDGRQRD